MNPKSDSLSVILPLRAEVDCNWSFDLVMEQTIVDADGNALGGVPGGITTYLRNIQKGEPTCVTSSKWGTNPPPEGISETIKAGIEALNIAAIAQTIEKGLSGAGSFVLPGNGSFDMTEPILNNNGDWLCKLTYKDSELKKQARRTERFSLYYGVMLSKSVQILR